MEPALVADRTCGPCIVCCKALTIEDPALQKPQGHLCRYAVADKGCGIYETRPQTCRIFYCGWRRLKWIRETLRPDRSGVLVRLDGELATADGTLRPGVMFTLLTDAALDADGLAESVAAGVAAGMPVYIDVPGPPGHTSTNARVNEALHDAVVARDKAAVLQILRQIHATASSMPHRPIVLDRRANTFVPRGGQSRHKAGTGTARKPETPRA
jgi:hypothetical protein